MSPKLYRLTFARHSSTSLPSGFSKDNLGLQVEESVCDKYQNFTVNKASGAMAHGENCGLWIHKQVERVLQIHRAVISFSLKVNFDDVLSVLIQEITELRSTFSTTLVQHIINFNFVKQEQINLGRKQ